MSKPPKHCLRLALRVLDVEVAAMHRNADHVEANIPGLRSEFVEDHIRQVRFNRSKAARLAKAAAWMREEIGDTGHFDAWALREGAGA